MISKLQLSVGFVFLIALNAFLNLGLNSGKRDKPLYFNVQDDLGHRQLQMITEYDKSKVSVPIHYVDVADVWEPFVATEQPAFWYISKSGGATFSTIVAKCLGLVQCSPKGDTTGKSIPNAPPVQIITHDDDHGKYLNVNPVDSAGISLLASENAVGRNLADIIITPRVTEVSELMTSANRGRLMVMLRHPVKREIDLFYYRQAATWDPNFDSQLALMSINDYVDSNKLLDNFVTRSLLGLDQSAEITAADMITAKALLRQKFIIGIFEWYEASISRFEKYVGWWDRFNVNTDVVVNQCHFDAVNEHGHDEGWNPDVPHGSPTYNKFIIRSWADVELYAYAKHLYSEQNLIFQ